MLHLPILGDLCGAQFRGAGTGQAPDEPGVAVGVLQCNSGGRDLVDPERAIDGPEVGVVDFLADRARKMRCLVHDHPLALFEPHVEEQRAYVDLATPRGVDVSAALAAFGIGPRRADEGDLAGRGTAQHLCNRNDTVAHGFVDLVRGRHEDRLEQCVDPLAVARVQVEEPGRCGVRHREAAGDAFRDLAPVRFLRAAGIGKRDRGPSHGVGGGTCRHLLAHMREFVRHEMAAVAGARRVFAAGEGDVGAQGKRAGVDCAGCRVGLGVGMDTHAGEVAAEAWLEEGAVGSGQGPARAEGGDRFTGGASVKSLSDHGAIACDARCRDLHRWRAYRVSPARCSLAADRHFVPGACHLVLPSSARPSLPRHVCPSFRGPVGKGVSCTIIAARHPRVSGRAIRRPQMRVRPESFPDALRPDRWPAA